MRTTRLLPVSPSMHCAGGVSALGGMSAPGEGVCILVCTEADSHPVDRMTDRQVQKHNLRMIYQEIFTVWLPGFKSSLSGKTGVFIPNHPDVM